MKQDLSAIYEAYQLVERDSSDTPGGDRSRFGPGESPGGDRSRFGKLPPALSVPPAAGDDIILDHPRFKQDAAPEAEPDLSTFKVVVVSPEVMDNQTRVGIINLELVKNSNLQDAVTSIVKGLMRKDKEPTNIASLDRLRAIGKDGSVKYIGDVGMIKCMSNYMEEVDNLPIWVIVLSVTSEYYSLFKNRQQTHEGSNKEKIMELYELFDTDRGY